MGIFTGESFDSLSTKLVMLDVLISLIPLSIAALVGLLIGWSWRPQFASVILLALKTKSSKLVWTAPPGFGARRVWFALTALLSAFTLINKIWRRSKAPKDDSICESSPNAVAQECATSSDAEDEQIRITEQDLKTLFSYIEGKDGCPQWQLMMDRSTEALAYQAWRRDPEVGPTQYRTRTVIENMAPELVRDFFWDDELRTKWDEMLVYCKTLQECLRTGTMIVHWIRKFPFFCSDREYIIIRRIWESGGTYYCVTKSTRYPSLPRHKNLRRVDLYYSSWRIKAVESRNVHGQLKACEILLFHHEEMGIPKELARIGVQMGMWGLIKNLELGVQAYQTARIAGASPSRYAFMASINTKVPETSELLQFELERDDVERDDVERDDQAQVQQRPKQGNSMLKWLIIGGVVVFCGFNGGAIAKGMIFGITRGFGQIQRRKPDTRQVSH